MLFGCDFFSSKKASEINFWNDLIYCSRDYFPSIVVLSVNNRPVPYERPWDNVHLYNVRPWYPGHRGIPEDPEYSGRRFHHLPMAPIYKSFSLVCYLRRFDELIEQYRVGVVHYMRIFGLLNPLLIARHSDVAFTITVPTHIDRGFPLHLVYHSIKNRALAPMDRVIATSEATRSRLETLGLDPRKLVVIPWSTVGAVESGDPVPAAEIYKRLGVPPDREMVLWSGPLQDTGTPEFQHALAIARRIAMQSDRYTFVFAIKPGRLREIVPDPVAESARIRVLETDRPTFAALRSVATAFLSPICNSRRTVAPPLTWIEMMQDSTPVVTTRVAGAEELIRNGVDGLIEDGLDRTVERMLAIDPDEWGRMGRRAKESVGKRYAMKRIVDDYVALWHTLMKGQGEG